MSTLLRWIGGALLRGAEWLERAPRRPDVGAWDTGMYRQEQRVFEMRTRILCGYY